MKTRLISIACMLPFLAFIIIGKLPLLIVAMLVSAAAMFEFYRGFERLEIRASFPVAAALLLALYGIIYASVFYVESWELYETLIDVWFFAVVAASLLLILLDKGHNILGPTYTMVGIFYIGFNLSHMVLIEQREHAMAWLPLIVAFLTDTGGFFGGMYFGKHRLAPALSPKKTVEGAIGGIILSLFGSIIFALIACQDNFLLCVIIGLLGAVIAELGDLTASAFKRKIGVKDFSNLIPGHGGVLDRMDSVVFVAPFVYYCMVLFFK